MTMIKRFPSVASPESPNPQNFWDTMGQCNFTSRSRVRLRQSMGRVAHHADKVQLYLAFTRSTTPIHGKGCAWRRQVGKKVQLCLAFARSTTPIHGKGCPSRRQGATLPRVRALDHANPWEGLRVTPQSCNYIYSRSHVRPRLAIHGKGCAWRRQGATLPRVHTFDHANPWEGLRVAPTCWKKCATLPGVRAFDHANPW